MDKTISAFYDEIQSNSALAEEIKTKVLEYRKRSDKEKYTTEIINEVILPIAKKSGFNISAKDIIDYENKLSSANGSTQKQELSIEDLENVNGGLGVRTAAVSLFAIIGLSSLSTGAMSFADNPTSAMPADTSISISPVDQDGTSGNTTNNVSDNQVMSEEETINAVIEDITQELKSYNFDFTTSIDTKDLHSTNNNDTLSNLVKNFDEKSKEIASKLNSQSSFKSLNELVKNNSEVLNNVFSKINSASLTAREKVAANLIVDDWAILNGFSHYASLTASPYFINEKGNVFWPDNNGYQAGTEIKNIINDLNPGYKIDRYGSEYGFYVASANGNTSSSYAQRALASRENNNLYHKYSVIRSFSELSNVIDELGLNECLELEAQAVNAYKEVKDKIKPDFQIHNKGSNPYAIEDGFNYKQLQSLIANNVDNNLLVSGANSGEVQAKFNEIKEILDKIDEVFTSAKSTHANDANKIQSLQNNVKGGFINLTDNVKNARANSGEIAPAFKQQGGGTQMELPCGVALLKDLGFLQNIND